MLKKWWFDDTKRCAALVASSRPSANGATYSATGGTACYAEFGMVAATPSSAWQTCLLQAGGGGTASCADEFTSVFTLIQSTCCASASDCDHGAPTSCNQACGDLVLDFWQRCESAVASNFGAAMHDQLDTFARTCELATGAGDGTRPCVFPF